MSDTIEIGKLVTGNYVVYFRASLSPDPFNCDSVSATSKLFQIKVNEPTFEIHSINATNRLINSEVKVNTKMLITGASKTTFKNQFLRNDTLFIEECYYAEDDTEPKFYDDTFYFKNLKAGLYIVQFKANRTSDKNSCFIQNTLVKYSQFIVRKYKIIINSIITTPIIPKPDQFFKITTNVTTAFSGQLIKLGQYINKDTIFLNYCIYDDGKQIEKTFNLDYTISLPIENNYVAMIKITASNNYTKCIDSYSADSLIYFSIQYNDIHKYNKYPKPIVYPNPFKNNINFSGDPVRSFVILNSLGQSIYSEVNIGSKKEINLEILPRGVYTIELILNNGRIYREKLLKE